jgi:hypothetical protein
MYHRLWRLKTWILRTQRVNVFCTIFWTWRSFFMNNTNRLASETEKQCAFCDAGPKGYYALFRLTSRLKLCNLWSVTNIQIDFVSLFVSSRELKASGRCVISKFRGNSINSFWLATALRNVDNSWKTGVTTYMSDQYIAVINYDHFRTVTGGVHNFANSALNPRLIVN